jgi:membrane-bound lytic murein transglycosylase A
MVHQTIRISSTIAPNASRKSSHIVRVLEALRGAHGAGLARTAAAAILGWLAACSSVPLPPLPAANAPTPDAATPAPLDAPAIVRAHARWVPVRFSDLPGWQAVAAPPSSAANGANAPTAASGDRLSELWPALLRGCERPAAGWAGLCAQARGAVTPPFSDEAARDWLQQRLQPYRVEALDGATDGLMTGYFEPLVDASRQPRGAFRVALYAPPADLAARKPYWTRQQVDTMPAAQASVRAHVLAYVADPLDALILQIQGSGRLMLTEADGSRKLLRVAFAGHNDQPYKSVGRWLIDQGELQPAQASWPGIKAWARQNPKRLNELLWSNPRLVFFREEPLPDPTLGPRGAQGVALTPGRSIAVDALSIPYGTPVWVDSTEPLSATLLRRLVMAQDTGTAINGAVRADYFWGWGADAEAQAGRMKQPLRLWVLWPKG